MGKVKQFQDNDTKVEFWAEHGLVYLSNEKYAAGKDFENLPREERLRIFKGLPPKIFLKQALAVAAFNYRKFRDHPKDLRRIKQFLLDIHEVYNEAVNQGAFDDPKADDWKLKHKNLARKQLVLPTGYYNIADKAEIKESNINTDSSINQSKG